MKTIAPIIENDLFIIRKLLLIAGIICFVLGVLAVTFEWRNLGSLLLLVAIFILFNLYWKNEKYKDYRKLYAEHLPNEKVSEMLNYGTFKFTEKQLIFKTKTKTQKINWTDLSSFKLIDSKHIVIKRKEKSESNLIISETEMDKSNFGKVIKLIKNYCQYTELKTKPF